MKDDFILTVGKKKFVLLSGDIAHDDTFHNLLMCDCVDRVVVERIVQAARLVEAA